MMNYTDFSTDYTVQKLTSDDIPMVFDLCRKNPRFYEHCTPFVTPQSIRDDMVALPPRKTAADKYYLGYFDAAQRLVAVMDFIDHYPTEQSAFIGFFMMEKDLQGQGTGSRIIEELAGCLKRQNYRFIRLGYVDGNKQSESFWKKNQFTDTGLRDVQTDYTVVVMNRDL